MRFWIQLLSFCRCEGEAARAADGNLTSSTLNSDSGKLYRCMHVFEGVSSRQLLSDMLSVHTVF